MPNLIAIIYMTAKNQVWYNKYYLKPSVHDYPKHISLCRHVESLVCVGLMCTNSEEKSITSEES